MNAVPAQLFRQPTATKFELTDLVKLVAEGRLRVPHFQRGLRWTTSDVVKLFDSILRGFPVGSVLLWKRTVASSGGHLGALSIPASGETEALWVVDGQQRVTCLVNALSAEAYQHDERFRLDYSLEKRAIVRHADVGSGAAIPLPELFNLRSFLAWIQHHPEVSDAVDDLNDVATTLRQFELPASVVEDPDPRVLREIFDRTNTAGKRLSRAEVFSALFAPAEGDAGTALTISSVAEGVDATGTFGRVDDDTVLRVVLARRGADVTRDIRGEFEVGRRLTEVEAETEEEAYARGRDALLSAVVFLQNRAGVPHFSFLPYRYMLVTLARFFAHFPEPRPRNAELLSRWFWQGSLRGPELFKGSATGAMRTLCTQIHPGDESGSVQRLLDSVHRPYDVSMPSLDHFRTNQAASRAVLCALWELQPRSLADGTPIDESMLAAALEGEVSAAGVAFEVVPRRRVPARWTATAANRLIQLPGDEDLVRDLLRGREHLGWGETPVEEALRSHLISTVASDRLVRGDDEGYLRVREEDLSAHLASFVQRRTGETLEPTPPLDDFDHDDIRDDAGDAVEPH